MKLSNEPIPISVGIKLVNLMNTGLQKEICPKPKGLNLILD